MITPAILRLRAAINPNAVVWRVSTPALRSHDGDERTRSARVTYHATKQYALNDARDERERLRAGNWLVGNWSTAVVSVDTQPAAEVARMLGVKLHHETEQRA